MTKSEIRKSVLKLRDGLSIDDINAKSRMILENVTNSNAYSEAENIMIYASMRSEVVTDEIILDALSLGKKVFCPKVTDKDKGIMEFVRIFSLEDLIEGYFKIREPNISDQSEVFSGQTGGNTLMIMPGVAFDKDRNRIGYSGGFYDRYLEKHPDIKTCALLFDCQIVTKISAEDHDKKPVFLFTESGLYS